MTAEDIARLRELCASATPGPWTAKHRFVDAKSDDDEIAGLGWEIEGPPEPILRGQFARAADAHLMAAARTTIPALLDEVGRLRLRCDYLERRLGVEAGPRVGVMDVDRDPRRFNS